MTIAIVGAGAVGGTFGARLFEAGKDVVFIARGRTLELLNTQGLRFNDLGEEKVLPIPAVASLAEVDDVECVILATKAIDPGTAFVGMPTGVPVMLTQNSVESPVTAAEQLGREWVVPGVVRGYMHYLGPADIAFTPGPLSFNVGPTEGTNEQSQKAARALVAALNDSGVGGEYREDIMVDVWMKAMFVATTGALGAAARAPLGVLRTTLRPQLEQLMREVDAAGRAHGVPLPGDAVERTLMFADQMPDDATTSMQRDYMAGVPCELDAQLGAVVRMARAAGVRVPACAQLTALLKYVAQRDAAEPTA